MGTTQVVRVDVTRNDRIAQEGPDHDENQATHDRKRIYAGRHHGDCPCLHATSPPLPKPLSAAATLRVAAIENLVPPRALWMVSVGQPLGDNALEVGVNHGPVQRPPVADNAVGERYPSENNK
jgi:hypothetical protein